MIQFRCTAKVQKEFDIKPDELAETKSGNTQLGNWYINLFKLDCQKTYIFVNEKTLLSFILFGNKKSNAKNVPEMFLIGLGQLLIIEGFEQNKVDKILNEYQSYEFTKTISKSILGSINGLVDLYKHSILYQGGFEYADIGKIVLQMNRVPQKNLGWTNSIKIVKEILDE
jgi:hypothetical protein